MSFAKPIEPITTGSLLSGTYQLNFLKSSQHGGQMALFENDKSHFDLACKPNFFAVMWLYPFYINV